MNRRFRAAVVLAGCLSALALLLSACGSSSDSSSSSSSSSTAQSTGGGASSVVAAATKALETVSGPNGTYTPPPSGGPKATPGKSVYVVSYGQAISYFSAQAKAMQDAASKLKWKLKVWDGKFKPNEWLAGVRQAVTAKADGIVLQGPDCASVKAGLQAAKAAGIPVVSIQGYDCNWQDATQKPLFTWAVTYNEGSLDDLWQAAGKYQADWAIVHSNGEAKVLAFRESDALAFHGLDTGFDKALKQCTKCKVVGTVKITGADYGPTLQQKAQQALLSNPDANIVYPAGAEAGLDGGIAAAIRSSSSKPISTGNTGGPNSKQYITKGIAGMTLNTTPGWEGWAALDGLVKLFGGAQPPSKTGLGLRLVDKDHNFDSFTPYEPPIEFKSVYERSWGVG